ncbi:MAG TPA: hypothetical protein VN844_28590 [Pyrinomonadaceae bacterium]|nr:hypothetical protein [Pyrinomonadaceae bacterium]
MGTAGLDVKRLQGLLERQKVVAVLLEGDEAQDHAVLELSSVRQPNLIARLEYENKGFEPRIAVMSVGPIADVSKDSPHSTQTIQLYGSRADDVDKIVQLVQESFLAGVPQRER